MTRVRTLDNLLRIKKMEEDEIRIELKRISREIDECQRRIACLESELERHKNAFEEKHSAGGLSAGELEMYCRYFTENTGRTMEEIRRAEAAREELERARATLVEVFRESRLVESLRDRVLKHMEECERKRERKETDNLYISRGRRE